jgi:ectoine hydroxylase-related dioxygenase (phytanoyl-CoA dioxygenase family)
MQANLTSDIGDSPKLCQMIEAHGFAVIPDVVNSETLDLVVEDLARASSNSAVRRRNDQVFGIRNLLSLVPSTRKLAECDAILSLARAIVGANARVVRSLCFEKSDQANWKVAWHQDVTIAVRSGRPLKGFGPWTAKGGIVHGHAPASVLENMIALRIHLDDANGSNGALKVIPGSHRLGRLTPTQIEHLIRKTKPVLCNVPRGGVLVMRPLLLHSSSAGFRPSHRRVVHLEFAGIQLPGGLEWYGQ